MFALLFDMDGVIVDTEGPNVEATVQYFRDAHGVEMVAEDFVPYIGRGTKLFVGEPAKKYGLEIDLERVMEEREEVFVSLLEASDSIVFPGVQALIQAIQDDPEFKLAIATSSQASKARASLGIGNVDVGKFDAFVTGDLVERKKPDPEIYNLAASKVGVDAPQCFVIEDSIAGVSAAKAAGMTCIAVTNTFRADELEEADLVVDSLEGVTPESLRALLAS